jgi:hypothetical protein
VGDIEYVYAWTGRVLSGADASTLHGDPYVIFDSGGGPATPLAMPPFRKPTRFVRGR